MAWLYGITTEPHRIGDHDARRNPMKRSAEVVVGLDIGTTSVKSVLVDSDGNVLADFSCDQSIATPHTTWAEQHPHMWWDATIKAIKGALTQLTNKTNKPNILGICVSGQMHSSVFLDAHNHVIRPAILWNDMRTTEQCETIVKTIGHQGLLKMVGNLALEGFTAPKVLWLRENEPNNYKKLTTLLMPKDYINFCLTGELCTDFTDASGTLLFDIKKRVWSQDMAAALDVPINILPELAQSTAIIGKLTKEAAKLLTLPEGTPIICGGADNATSAVGMGVLKEGDVQSSIGTSGTILSPTSKPNQDPEMRLHSFCHSVQDSWYLMGTIISAGNSLKWIRSILSDENVPYSIFINQIGSVPVGSDGLIFLPYLMGERTPHNDAGARGVFFGLHSSHTKAHMIRAVMEGVCFALKDSIELINTLGQTFDTIRTTGGGSNSRTWQQMQSDIFGKTLAVIGPATGAAYGAALLGVVGTGVFGTVNEATKQWLHIKDVITPDKFNAQLYAKSFDMYRDLYPALKQNFIKASR